MLAGAPREHEPLPRAGLRDLRHPAQRIPLQKDTDGRLPEVRHRLLPDVSIWQGQRLRLGRRPGHGPARTAGDARLPGESASFCP